VKVLRFSGFYKMTIGGFQNQSHEGIERETVREADFGENSEEEKLQES
jgi:hypothetical protein